MFRGHLIRDAFLDILLRQAVPRGNAPQPRFRPADNQPGFIGIALHPAFKQQRRVQHHQILLLRAAVLQDPQSFFNDPARDDLLQRFLFCCVRKNKSSDLFAIEVSVTKKNIFAKGVFDFREAGTACFRHLMRNQIRVDNLTAFLSKICGNRRFPGADAACETNDFHIPSSPILSRTSFRPHSVR